MPETTKRVIIIGAGPIGIECAVYAKQLGYAVTVFEKGDIGEHLRQWGHVRLFSPFSMNHTPLGRRILQAAGQPLPADGDYLTGREHRETYLLPLVKHAALDTHIRTGCKVVAVSRQGIFKGDFIGTGERRKYPFRVLIEDADGAEETVTADAIIDASGSYSNPNWLGDGGIPAIGERTHRDKISYHLEEITNGAAAKYLGKTTLLVGDGQSAGTTMQSFGRLLEANDNTRLIWLTRHNHPQPIAEIPDDPLPGRLKVAQDANRLATHPRVTWKSGSVVEALRFDPTTDQFDVTIRRGSDTEEVRVDRIIANVGYAPDNSIYRELQVHECYASCGPMKLAAALLAESGSADCLTQTGKGPDVLKNPEPDFYILGMKSYGRNSNFLLRVGFEQVRDVFKLITGDTSLDLYAG
jgi:hypothetical protein